GGGGRWGGGSRCGGQSRRWRWRDRGCGRGLWRWGWRCGWWQRRRYGCRGRHCQGRGARNHGDGGRGGRRRRGRGGGGSGRRRRVDLYRGEGGVVVAAEGIDATVGPGRGGEGIPRGGQGGKAGPT